MREYLDQLKQQQAAITGFLQVKPPPVSRGVRIAIDIYIHILEDAAKSLQSLIEYFEHRDVLR
jgi:hypothetical protein